MKIFQEEIRLAPRKRGCHIISHEIEQASKELAKIHSGLVHIFIKHTSAGLTINENADPSVISDFNSFFNKLCPETKNYSHYCEDPDDMPAHLKSSIVGSSLTVPITNGKFNLGIWQGIYLCEFRENGGSREIVITIFGE